MNRNFMPSTIAYIITMVLFTVIQIELHLDPIYLLAGVLVTTVWSYDVITGHLNPKRS